MTSVNDHPVTHATGGGSDRPITLVTGAGSGVGRSTALALAAKGHALALCGRSRAKLVQVATEIKALRCCDQASSSGAMSNQPIIIEAVLGERDEGERVVREAVSKLGAIDNLVNCAGAFPKRLIANTTPEFVREMMNVNAFSAADLILACWSGFCRRRRGCIVNLSSKAAFDPFPGFFAYAAGKAAMDSFIRSADREGAPLGIRCFSLNLGLAETAAMRELFDKQTVPATDCLSPEEVAMVILDCIEGRRPKNEGAPFVVDRQSVDRDRLLAIDRESADRGLR